MKIGAVASLTTIYCLLHSFFVVSNAFTPLSLSQQWNVVQQQQQRQQNGCLVPLQFSSSSSSTIDSTSWDGPSDVEEMSVSSAKLQLVEVAEKLKAENGFLVLAKGAREELKRAVEDLENASSGTITKPTIEQFLGNWTLLVSTSTNRDGFDSSKLESLPAPLSDTFKKIRSNILDASNRFLVVQQRIRSTKDNGVVDRVDIILEFEPPEQLGDVVRNENIPDPLRNVKLNPLAVSKSKVVLIHKAEILSEVPVLKTKITLESIVLNVAGTSRVLDPNGKDVAGINLPNLGEFLPNSNSDTGEFVTTFCDQDLRVSRGKLAGNVEQLRVFYRTEVPTLKVNIQDEMTLDEEIVDIEPFEDEEEEESSKPPQGSSSSNKGDDDIDKKQPGEMDP